MLFNSPEFIFLFLPITLLLFVLGQRMGGNYALHVIALASFFFYSWWDIHSLPILLTSIGINWALGEWIRTATENNQHQRARIFCGAGIAANLILLIYYKYSGFIVKQIIEAITGKETGFIPPELPIGVSFFTFTQIAYLIDTVSGKSKKYSPVHYAIFVNYFPHLIAGPILHHAEMMPQFESVKKKTQIRSDLAIGGGIFLIGMSKKLLIADPLGTYVNIFYSGLSNTTATPGFFECLLGSLAYSLQLYFDFSGYSDMAIGISRMFGIDLPLNFNSPYKSTNIIEFWRRWHISLSTFLKDYLYIPLGGGRKGTARRFLNLFITMLLGGMWHGAGWTFIIWGAIHGVLLSMNHALIHIFGPPKAFDRQGTITRAAKTVITFIAVTLAWIPFRAPDLETTQQVISGLFGLNGASLPQQVLSIAPFLNHIATGVGNVPLLADGTVMGFIEMSILSVIGLGLAWLAPNTQEMKHAHRLLIGALVLPLILQKVIYGGKVEFLYFQF